MILAAGPTPGTSYRPRFPFDLYRAHAHARILRVEAKSARVAKVACAMLCRTTLCYVVLRYAMSYYAMLCRTVLCRAVLCHTMRYERNKYLFCRL